MPNFLGSHFHSSKKPLGELKDLPFCELELKGQSIVSTKGEYLWNTCIHCVEYTFEPNAKGVGVCQSMLGAYQELVNDL